MYKLDSDNKLIINRLRLTSLSELPDGIRVLDCSDNKLEYLPKLPDSLEFLYCANNNITSLDDLPNKLIYLDCSCNHIKYLPEISKNFYDLYCHTNPLECLVPNDFYLYQNDKWFVEYYFPYIRSYDGQKNILTKYPNKYLDLIHQTEILPSIRKEFAYLIDAYELNLL